MRAARMNCLRDYCGCHLGAPDSIVDPFSKKRVHEISCISGKDNPAFGKRLRVPEERDWMAFVINLVNSMERGHPLYKIIEVQPGLFSNPLKSCNTCREASLFGKYPCVSGGDGANINMDIMIMAVKHLLVYGYLCLERSGHRTCHLRVQRSLDNPISPIGPYDISAVKGLVPCRHFISPLSGRDAFDPGSIHKCCPGLCRL